MQSHPISEVVRYSDRIMSLHAHLCYSPSVATVRNSTKVFYHSSELLVAINCAHFTAKLRYNSQFREHGFSILVDILRP